jgi:hypothetical protein
VLSSPPSVQPASKPAVQPAPPFVSPPFLLVPRPCFSDALVVQRRYPTRPALPPRRVVSAASCLVSKLPSACCLLPVLVYASQRSVICVALHRSPLPSPCRPAPCECALKKAAGPDLQQIPPPPEKDAWLRKSVRPSKDFRPGLRLNASL